MPLTDVLDQTGWTNLNSKIDAMQASGYTTSRSGWQGVARAHAHPAAA